MEHRVSSQSTLTRQQPQHPMAPHSSLPPHMQTEQQMINHMKMMNGGGSPRGYNSMERSYSNQPTIPQGQGPPPSYAPSPFQYNSLQRNNPMQMPPGHPQMMQQMSMPAPTPPPPYGGTLTHPQMVNGNSNNNMMIPQLTPQQSSASLQFGPQATANMGYPVEMQFNPAQGMPHGSQMPGMIPGQFGMSSAYPPLPQPQQVHISQSSTLPLNTGSMQSVNSSMRSRSKSRSSKTMVLRVLLLDGTTPKFDLSIKSTGGEFYQKVVDHLNLLETDYFGLQYAADHAGSVYWLEMQKPICKQVKAPAGILFRFAVKFYTSEPGQLQDEYTKVLFALQIKRDMACGMLPCAENTAALMASYIVQAELGDFDVEKNSGIGGPDASSPRYLSMFKFIPPQTDEFLVKVMEYHKNHIGQSAAEADFSLLDIARRLEMYGIRLHPARNSDDVLVHIAVSQHGISVFQHFQKSNSFAFSKIRKLSFKKKAFVIKLLTDAVSSFNQSTVEYLMTSRNACKRFWKDCIEHHAFFRLPHNEHAIKPQNSVKILQSGSSFRYAGRTQREMAEQVRSTNQARLQVRRPGSSIGAPISKTLPAKSFEASPATVSQMTPGTPGSMSGMQMVPGMGMQMVPSTMPPKRQEMDPNMILMQQQQQMIQGSMHGSMQQLQQPAVAIAPFNRMSATSPLPQQLMSGTPLLNRSGTPLNDGSQPMRPQMIPLAMSNQGINQMGMQLMSPGEQQQHQQMMQQQQNLPHLPPNNYHPQLPPHLTKQYHPESGISGEVIQENDSDHDYENYPVNGEGQQQNHNQTQNAMIEHSSVQMMGGNAQMMRPPSRQRDSIDSEGKYMSENSRITHNPTSPYVLSASPLAPGANVLPSNTNINNSLPRPLNTQRLPSALYDPNRNSQNSPLQFQHAAASSSRGSLQKLFHNNNNVPVPLPALSHQNSRSSITDEFRKRGLLGNSAYGTSENPYGEGPYDFKSSYSECPYGMASNVHNRPADIIPKRHGSQELLQSRAVTNSRSLENSAGSLQSPVSPPALPPVMGQPISAQIQPMSNVQMYYQQQPPVLSLRGPMITQGSSIYGSNRPTLERIEERFNNIKINENGNTDTENGDEMNSKNGNGADLSSSESSLTDMSRQHGRSYNDQGSSGNSRGEKRFPELQAISPSNSPHTLAQFSMSNFNTLDSCTTNKFSVAASNDFSIVGDDELMEKIRRSTDTLDRGSVEINPDTVLSPTMSHSSHSSTPFRDRDLPPMPQYGNNAHHQQFQQRSRNSSQSQSRNPSRADEHPQSDMRQSMNHPYDQRNIDSRNSNTGDLCFLNSSGLNEDLNDVDDVSCASEEVFGRGNLESEKFNSPATSRGGNLPPSHFHQAIPSHLQHRIPQSARDSPSERSMTNFSNATSDRDRFNDADSYDSNAVINSYLRQSRSRSPADFLSSSSAAPRDPYGGIMDSEERRRLYSPSKSTSFDILQQLTNVDHKESVSDEGEESNYEEDFDNLDDN